MTDVFRSNLLSAMLGEDVCGIGALDDTQLLCNTRAPQR